MAKTSSSTGIYNSKNYELKTLELISSTGNTIDIRNIFVEMQIFQDIFSSVMSGNILINDGRDTFSAFNLCGNEFLKISIDKPGLGLPLERIFRIYKSSNRSPSTDAGQTYILHFCSDEMLSSQQILVSKSYKSAKIKDVISDILLNELNVDSSRINILENTSGNFDFIIPNYRPFEAIQWAAGRAYDQKKFCYFFFENKKGFNLTSIQTLMKQKPYKTIKYELKNTSNDPANNKDSIDNFKIINDFDMISSISNGSFSSRLLSVDIFSQSFTPIDYSLATAEAQGNLLNKYKPVNSFKNSKNKNLFDSSESFFRTYLAINDTASEKSNDIKYWMLPRAMHMAALNNFRIEVTLPGDIELKAGDVIKYEFPKFISGTQAGKEFDKARTGNYLVSSINHKFSEDTFESIVELISDSVSEQIPVAKDGINRLTKKGK